MHIWMGIDVPQHLPDTMSYVDTRVIVMSSTAMHSPHEVVVEEKGDGEGGGLGTL